MSEQSSTDFILSEHFSKYLEDDLNLGFYPYFIGSEKCRPQKAISRHTNAEEYTFHLILSGAGYLVNNGQAKRLTANDTFFIPPRSTYGSDRDIYYYPDKNDPWEYIWVNFVGEETEKLVRCAKFTLANNYYSVQNAAFLKQQWRDMIGIAKNTAKRNVSFYMPFVMKFFAEIADERKMSNEITTAKEKKVKRITDVIERTYTEQDFSIGKIAESMFYTTSYISRIFKEVTNTSPMEYVTRLRMLRAKDLLRSGTYSISQIAYLIGYNSPFYFSKEFKKYYGFSPSRFSE
ncbi:MAG: helix-turn-helix domain-containing protein [Clostridia bacterium]|nr:helix-turn-helix domain-containing protein [Clostridia bacterium]